MKEVASPWTIKDIHPFVLGGAAEDPTICTRCGLPDSSNIHKFKVADAGVSVEASVPPSGLPDSGLRESFGEGMAVREDGSTKPSIEGTSPFAMERLGLLFTKGGIKYKDFRNWEKGMPVTRYIGAILRHTFKYLARDETEDHLAAIMWNVQCLIHHEEAGTTSGKTFADIDDRPRWTRTKKS